MAVRQLVFYGCISFFFSFFTFPLLCYPPPPPPTNSPLSALPLHHCHHIIFLLLLFCPSSSSSSCSVSSSSSQTHTGRHGSEPTHGMPDCTCTILVHPGCGINMRPCSKILLEIFRVSSTLGTNA